MKQNKPKHTPGPWVASTEKGITTCDGKPKVFYKKGPFFCIIDGVDNDLEATANAQLIAAAPDMLKLIEMVADGKFGERNIRDWAIRLSAKARGDL